MSKRWAALIVTGILALGAWTGAAEAQSSVCNAGTYDVDTGAEATDIAGGYNNPACDLIIRISIPVAVDLFNVTARSITIIGPGVAIQDPGVNGTFLFNATGGDFRMDGGTITASKEIDIFCLPVTCTIDIKNSVVIASSNQQFNGPGGQLIIRAGGPVDIATSTIYAGLLVKVQSNNSFVKVVCQGGNATCTDPNTAKPAIITSQCGDPIVFPCNAIFQNAAELSQVCTPAINVQCGGGSKQVDFIAKTDVIIDNLTFTSTGIFNVQADTGTVSAQNANLSAKVFNFRANNASLVSPAIDLDGAMITSSTNIRVIADKCPAPIAVNDPTVSADSCVSVNQATLLPRAGSSFPRINSDNSPPFDTNTIDTNAECTAAGFATGVAANKGDLLINAQNNTGKVFICETSVN